MKDAGGVKGRLARWKSFMAEGAAPGFLFMARPQEGFSIGKAPMQWPEKRKERVEFLWQSYQKSLERCAAIDDDSLPYLNMLTGTEIFAEAFGCQVHRPEEGMPFALPLIRSADEVARIKIPKLGNCSLDYLFEMADELKARAGDEALLRMVDLQSPMDIANLIWEKESLLMAMYESPEAVKELSMKVLELMTAFLDEWFRRYGKSFVAHFPDYYMEKGVTLSVDEVGIINPEMFEEFFKPELEALSLRYEGLGVHCCADARHQWENFRKLPGLKFLNFVKPPTRGTEYISDGLKFFAGKCPQLHYGLPLEGGPESWPGQHPANARAVIDLNVQNLKEAQELCQKLRNLEAVAC